MAGKGLATQFQLTERQGAFVAAYAKSSLGTASAIEAGYAPEWAAVEANRLLRLPIVSAALQFEVRRRITVLAPMALGVLEHLARNEQVADKVRLDAAKTLLDRAGHIAPRAKADSMGADLPLNEMTTAELRSLADKLEGEIAGRAKPVNAANAAPAPDQAVDLLS